MSSVQSPSSSASTLYAQPSKNWVIPPRPKPGRKPKKPVVEESGGEGETDESSKNKNRAAQRAFRERKQDQLATLQARIQQYEQGETEKHVQLQLLGKRLKEENDLLRKENAALKEEISRLKAEKEGGKVKTEAMDIDLSGTVAARKRATTASAPSGSADDIGSSRKRIRTSFSYAPSPTVNPSLISSSSSSANSPSVILSSASTGSASTPSSTTATTPSSSSMASSPNSTSSPQNSASVTEILRLNRDATASSSSSKFLHPHSRTTAPRILDKSSSILEPPGEIQIVDCGFCSEDTPCICRELAMNTANKNAAAPTTLASEEVVSPKQPTRITPQSILDNLPEYQPPVPLRKRKQNTTSTSQSLFPIIKTTTSSTTASCSGDPSNCGACQDDPFGRAFCTALSDACADGKCSGCPGRDRNLVEVGVEIETVVNTSSSPPAPGSLTPERTKSPAVGESGEVGVRCGRDRIKEVRTEGVRDAWAVLDEHLSQQAD
ncbi:hypothetical protein FRC02_001699 [Tulasnella sp. 418]|nr:hypothetical protein FRC02_001699 [Tulasnella sp. 418]